MQKRNNWDKRKTNEKCYNFIDIEKLFHKNKKSSNKVTTKSKNFVIL